MFECMQRNRGSRITAGTCSSCCSFPTLSSAGIKSSLHRILTGKVVSSSFSNPRTRLSLKVSDAVTATSGLVRSCLLAVLTPALMRFV